MTALQYTIVLSTGIREVARQQHAHNECDGKESSHHVRDGRCS